VERNALAYYRQEPGKLESHAKLYHFIYGATTSAGFFGFMVAVVIQQVSTVLSARAAGVEVPRPYPVHLNCVFMVFVAVVCFWLSGMSVGSINRLQMIRELLQERGAIATNRPDTTGIRLLGIAVGSCTGGLVAAGIMFALY
jgi:hypothetical protein